MFPSQVAILQPHDGGSSESPDEPSTIDLSSVKAVAVYLPFIDSARSRVTSDMEQMVINGLRTLVSGVLVGFCKLLTHRHIRTNLFLLRPFKLHITFESCRTSYKISCPI